ncbi:hypothetical protein [Actinoplanes sp. NPDC051851]|uniref:hypothetical protein n=1 Tax=Actinoplanes sp. NPDC051851 TaxID=3154753 RepID=UPI0034324436
MESGKRPPRWVPPVFAALGAATVPWTVYLALTLPARMTTTWVGFDLALAALLLATAYAVHRAHRLAGALAAAACTLLLADAWFDVTTSTGAALTEAWLTAALVELPLAVLCAWLAAVSPGAGPVR